LQSKHTEEIGVNHVFASMFFCNNVASELLLDSSSHRQNGALPHRNGARLIGEIEEIWARN
jgi:hypothetical protein